MKAGLPDDHPNITELSYIRTINLCATLIAIVVIPSSIHYFSMGVDIMGWGILFALVVATIDIVLLRKTHNLKLCGHIALLDFYFILLLSNSVSGGFYDPNFALFYVIPLAAGFAMGREALFIYFGLVLATTIAFFFLPSYGYEIPNLIPQEQHAQQSLSNRLQGILMVVALSFGFLYQREQAQKLLLKAKEAEEAAAIQRKALEFSEQTNQLKDEFLATVSHELRTPLNGMIGIYDLVKMQTEDEEIIELISLADISAQKMSSLVERILILAELQAGKREIKHEVFDPSSLFNQLEKQYHDECERKKLLLNYSIDDSLKQPMIGDLKLIQVICQELIENAIKFTDKGKVEVTAELLSGQDEENIPLKISVKDTGCGIPIDKQQTIFGYFEQADGSFHRKHDGLGIGLATAKQISRLMDAKLEVLSEVNQGSEFICEFNLSKKGILGKP